MSLGVQAEIFKRKGFGWINKLTVLLVSLSIQHPSKVNSSDNNLNFQLVEKNIYYL
jgi:hypothetical protein